MISEHIISQIYANFCFQPTSEQENVIKNLAEALAGGNHETITIINGHAGTGKTSIIAAFVKTLKSLNVTTFMLAPTGRAAKVLASYCASSAHTIHKKIYRQKSVTENKFSLDFNKTNHAFFIIDEASMISDSSYEGNMFGSGNLIDDLVDYVRSATGCHLIIIGDSSQLPPVGHSTSVALERNYMERYGSVNYLELKEVMRQEKLSGILYNATIVRHLIDNQQIGIPKFKIDYPDFISIDGGEVLEELESCYSKYGTDDTIVITRSNKQANRFNQAIRNRVLYMEEEVSSNDLLMVVKNNYHYKDEESGIDFIANGDIVKVRRIRRYEEIHGLRFVGATIQMPDYNDIEIDCKLIIDTLHSDMPGLTQQQSSNLFTSVEADYLDTKRKKERFEKIREDSYFNALQVKFGYAITCHKAQGGQWSAVFVDKMLFGDEQMDVSLQRWLYTAITRGTQKVYILNFDDRFLL